MKYPCPSDMLRVPYLGYDVEECNEINFTTYPAQQHVVPTELRKRGSCYSRHELNTIAGFLQQWLVCGLMRTLFAPSHITVDINDFVFSPSHDQRHYSFQNTGNPRSSSIEEVRDEEANDEEATQSHAHASEHISFARYPFFIDTTGEVLMRYLIYMQAKEFFLDDVDRKRDVWVKHISVFNNAQAALQELVLWRREFYPVVDCQTVDSPLLDTVILSAILLLESLYATFEHSFPLVEGRTHLLFDLPLDNALQRRLLDAHWCPGEVRVHLPTLSMAFEPNQSVVQITTLSNKFRHATSLYVLGGLDRGCLEKDHSCCTSDSCIANRIDPETYETKHASPGCDCAFLQDPSGGAASATRILQSGDIPVLTVTSNPDWTSPTLSVIPSRGIRYVALSHVWSDGLGNPRSNALPTCQLQKLQEWVDDLYPESSEHTAFWIDTLCVPLTTQERKKAIQLMGETYRAADTVLVLDDWLVKTGFDGLSEHNLLKLKSCTWTQRLWTLQEGMLAKEYSLYFQTSVGSISGDDLSSDISLQTDYLVDVLKCIVGRKADNLQDKYPETTTAILESLERHIKIWEDPSMDGDERYWRKGAMLSKGFDTGEEMHRDPLIGGMGLISEINNWLNSNIILSEGHGYLLSLRRPLGPLLITRRCRYNLRSYKRPTPMHQANEVMVVGHNMKNRSTSRLEDEPVCFATLLGLDLTEILDCRGTEERMEKVFSQLQFVSEMILFSHSPRINKEGLRWVPATFRTNARAYEPGIAMTNFGEVRREGLVAKFNGIVFETGKGSKVAVPRTQFGVGSLTLSIRKTGQHGLYPSSRRLWTAALLYGRLKVHVVDLDTNAILVELVESKDGVIFTRFIGHYHIKCEGERGNRTLKGLTGVVKNGQRWCIG